MGIKTLKEDPETVAKRSLDAKRMLDAAARSKAAKKTLDDAAAKKRSTMKEELIPVSDVITLVANDQHAEASGIVNDLLSARVLDSLQAQKEVIAHSLFAPSADTLTESGPDDPHDGQVGPKALNLVKPVGSYPPPKGFSLKKQKELRKKAGMKEEVEQLEEKNWIAGAIKHKGALHAQLHVPAGEKIPAEKLEAAAHKGGKLGHRARLAQTLKHLHEEEKVEEEYPGAFSAHGGTEANKAAGAKKAPYLRVPKWVGNNQDPSNKGRKPGYMKEEEIVQEEHESVEDFVKRGGKIKQVPAHDAHGAQKPQMIKKAKKYFVKKG